MVRYASKIQLTYGTLVRYGSGCEVRSTQILNAPYRTANLIENNNWPSDEIVKMWLNGILRINVNNRIKTEN